MAAYEQLNALGVTFTCAETGEQVGFWPLVPMDMVWSTDLDLTPYFDGARLEANLDLEARRYDKMIEPFREAEALRAQAFANIVEALGDVESS